MNYVQRTDVGDDAVYLVMFTPWEEIGLAIKPYKNCEFFS